MPMRHVVPKSNDGDDVPGRASPACRCNSGLTLIDLLVVMSGMVIALGISLYFRIFSPSLALNLFSLLFGISLWCFLFLWLLPLLRRRKNKQTPPDDDNHKP